MAEILRCIVGFELGADVTASGSSYGYLAESASNGYSASDITTGAKRSGTYGLSVALAASDNKYASVLLTPLSSTALPAAGTAWEMRARYYFHPIARPDANDLVISFTGTGITAFVARLEMNTSGALRAVPAFLGSTATAYTGATSLNTWYQVRLRCYGTGSGGVANGTTLVSAYALDVYSEDGSTSIASFSETITNGNNMPTVWPHVFHMGQLAGTGPTCTSEIRYDDFWCYLATDTDVAAMECRKVRKSNAMGRRQTARRTISRGVVSTQGSTGHKSVRFRSQLVGRRSGSNQQQQGISTCIRTRRRLTPMIVSTIFRMCAGSKIRRPHKS